MHFDLFKKRDRVLPGSSNYFIKNQVIEKTENDSLYYSVELPDVSKYWHNYHVHVTSLSCPLTELGVAAFRIPWSNEGSTTFLRYLYVNI